MAVRLRYIKARVQEHFSERDVSRPKNSIHHPILTTSCGIKDNGGFNPKPLKFRDFNVLSVTERAQIVWKLQRRKLSQTL